MTYTKSSFIQSFLLSREESNIVNSHFPYIIFVFADAGYIVIMSLQDAVSFNYINALFNTDMKTRIKRFHKKYQQYYYFIPSEFYINLSSLSIKIFKTIFNYPRNFFKNFDKSYKEILEIYLDTNINETHKNSIEKDYQQLLDLLGYK